jgi:transcriptional regulator with XRE-family HTH domain
MPSRVRLVEALKRCLRARGMTYAQLALAVGLSEPSVKRMFSRGTFTLTRLDEILAVLELDLYEVARMSRGADQGPSEMSVEQEAALAKDERLLSVFWLVHNGWRFADIVSEFSISKAELTLAVAKLARLKLVDWSAGERVRLRLPKDFRWRAGGPVKKAYGRRVTQEFLQSSFCVSSRAKCLPSRRQCSSAGWNEWSQNATNSLIWTLPVRAAVGSVWRFSSLAALGSFRS